MPIGSALAGLSRWLMPLCLVAGCGGKVVFDEASSGGGAASSSGAFKPGPEPDPRRDLCEGICPPSCAEPGCVEDCLDASFGAGCDALAGDLLACFGAHLDPTQCAAGADCGAEIDAFATCDPNSCSDGCSLAEQSCSCLRSCDDRSLQISCQLVADENALCRCSVDDEVLGECNETHLACDLDFGCCADLFGF